MVEILKEGLLSSNDGGALESGQFVPGGEGQDPRCPPKGRDGPPSRGQENLVGMIQVLYVIYMSLIQQFIQVCTHGTERFPLSISAVRFACPFKIS